MRVVADSHAVVWYVQGSSHLSADARDTLVEAERTDGIVVSVATLVDLWYVTQTTRAISADDLQQITRTLQEAAKVDLHPIDVDIVRAATAIARATLPDPWDRFIVATARALDLALVTRDEAIHRAALVEAIW